MSVVTAGDARRSLFSERAVKVTHAKAKAWGRSL